MNEPAKQGDKYTYKRFNDAWRLIQERVGRGHYSERQLRKLLNDSIDKVKWLHWMQDCFDKNLKDIIADEICKYRLGNLFESPFGQEDRHEEKAYGFVYVASQTNEKGVYKIGVTESITDREKRLSTGNAFIRFIATIKSENAYALENSLHKYFSGKRIKGEWFRLSADDLEFLINVCGFNYFVEGFEPGSVRDEIEAMYRRGR
jgi:hypothetical protein